MCEDRDLAKPVSGTEVGQLPLAASNGNSSLDEDEELPTTPTFLREPVASEASRSSVLIATSTSSARVQSGEERNPLEQVDLLVLAQGHAGDPMEWAEMSLGVAAHGSSRWRTPRAPPLVLCASWLLRLRSNVPRFRVARESLIGDGLARGMRGVVSGDRR